MINIRLILVVCLFFSLQSRAQVDFQGGLMAGAITSQVHGDTHSGFNKIGFTGGAYSELFFENIGGSVRLGIVYSQKGSRNKPDTKNGDFSYFKLELNYIEVPITLTYRYKAVDLMGGLYYGILLNSTQDNGSGPGEVIPAYNDYDIGGHFGVSYDLVEDKLFVCALMSNSILSTRPAPDIATQPGVGWDGGGFNTAIHLYLGYKL